jgi:spore maturation protein CgeB
MKIVILQEHGHHKENENFRESLNLSRAFKRLQETGKEVETVVTGPGYYNLPFINDLIKEANVVLCLENYERNNWVPDLSNIDAYCVFWTIDSHVRFGPHLSFAKKHKFDLILSSTSSIVPLYSKNGFNCQWFPNCYPKDLIDKRSIQKQYKVGFCGLFPGNRRQWYKNIEKFVDVHFDTFVIGESMVRAINSYHIHLNRNVKNDINYRTFETLGCETFLLTNKTDKLSELFNINEHLVVYSDISDCVEKIRFYLKNQSKRESIAEAGYKWVREKHSFDNRAHTLLRMLEERI